jgi:hypothetical protein
MNPRAKKILLLLLAGGTAALRFRPGAKSLNRDRDRLGMTWPPLDNAPPLLAFTTVALGRFPRIDFQFSLDSRQRPAAGRQVFRGGAARQLDHGPGAAFTQVWLFRAGTWPTTSRSSSRIFPTAGAGWSAASNCCATTACATTRRRADLPRAGLVFPAQDGRRTSTTRTCTTRQQWAEEMTPFFGRTERILTPCFPANAGRKNQRAWCSAKNTSWTPSLHQKVDDAIRPARLAAARGARHLLGREGPGRRRRRNPDKVKADDLITLRRIIYQSMLPGVSSTGASLTIRSTKPIRSAEPRPGPAKVNDAYVTHV